jgi:predicted dehydrogenase
VRSQGGKIEHQDFPKIDSLRFEIDAFADAAAGRSPYPITTLEMVNTIAMFDAIIRSVESGAPVALH